MSSKNEDREITFVMHTPQGDITMHVLYTFYSPETKANYMLYTPDDPEGKKVSLSACRYDPADLSRIMPLKDDTDRKIVQGFIQYISTNDPKKVAKAVPPVMGQ
ncbi:MAG: hypothetical protein ACOX68_08175 [Candidatus Limivicinus sp.]|jgi:hypothetical protein